MKSILRVFYSAFIIFLIPFSLVCSQEKKSEQKIKIIIDDGSGTKVVIDTLIKDGTMKDSIKLKDGNVIYLKHGGKDDDMINGEGKEHVFVTVSDDGKTSKKEVKNITVISSDSEKDDEAEASTVTVSSDSKGHMAKNGGGYRVITSSSGEGDKESRIYYNEGDGPENEMGKTFTVYVDKDGKKADAEKTKYVIKKNGMVVSVEGSDYEKVKELVKVIESNLDVKESPDSKSGNAKEENKNTGKKK